jgi:hypothetical protein
MQIFTTTSPFVMIHYLADWAQVMSQSESEGFHMLQMGRYSTINEGWEWNGALTIKTTVAGARPVA